MFLLHLRLAFRNIFRSKIYSLFNIVGFAMGFTVCIISGLYIYREFNVDTCYKDYRDIYRIVDVENNTSQMDYDLAKTLGERFPEIKNISPVLFTYSEELLLKRPRGDKYISVRNVISTESDFFTVFPLNFIAGNPADPFNSQYSVIVTRSIAKKLFGRTDIIGELINTQLGDIPVGAVIEEMPENSSLKADIIINSETGVRFMQSCSGKDCHNPYPIFALLHDGTDKKLLEEKINSNFPENKSKTEKIKLQPLSDIYFDKTVTDSNNLPGSRSMVFLFITIAIIVLALSVINYVNFALSRQLDTLRQLGVKKAYGASFLQLRAYYVVEISLSVLLALVLSFVISIYSIPLFEHILGVHLNVGYIFTPVFILSILAVPCIVVAISSLTPFYIISKFDIQMLFGKKQTYFGKQRGKMILTGCQMAVTVVMFICLLMLQKQLNYVKSYDLGFDKNHLIRIEMPNPKGNEAFKNEIAQYDFVQSSVFSTEAPGFMGSWEDERNEQNGRYVTINKIYADIDFINTFDLHLLQGRDFTDSDRAKSCIVSEETMRQLDWDTYEGKKCNGRQVIGVVKDFNVSSLHNRMEAVSIVPLEKEKLAGTRLSIRFKGDIPEVLDKLGQSWKNVFPDEPFNYRFYSEVFDTYYKKEERQSSAIAVISVIAIVITCMGLIGQVKQMSLSKAKEIGIRKINGATIAEMMLLVPKNFLKCFAVAFILAIPIAHYAMGKWLQNFAFQTPISWWVFAVSGLVVLVLLTLFVLWQTRKAAIANPVDIIKAE